MTFTQVTYSYGGSLGDLILEFPDDEYRNIQRNMETTTGWSPKREEICLLALNQMTIFGQRATGIVSAIPIASETAEVLRRKFPFYTITFEDVIKW